MSDDYKIPELPSDDELGIAGLSEEDLVEDDDASPQGTAGGAAPPKAGGGPGTGGGGGSGAGEEGSTRRPPPPGGPAWRGIVTLGVLVLGVWVTSSHRWLPAPRAANAPDDVFSSARAMTTVVEMARLPHPPGSPEHDRVRDLVVQRLADLGLQPEVDTLVHVRTPVSPDAPVRTVTVRNVLARVPGSASTGTVVLMAHYDGRTLARGAGDDATGVAAILETVRVLQDELPLRNDLLVLVTDAEELGLVGARAFVERHLDTADVKMVLNVEMRGGGGPSLMFETGAENGWAVRNFAEADPHPAANSMSLEIYRRMPNDTDFSPFRDAGVQGLNFAAIGRGNVYHQRYDDPAHLSEATLQHHGARLLAMARHFGEVPLDVVHAADRGYLVLPVVGMLHYPFQSVPLGAGVLAVLFVFATAVVLARGGTAGGAALGAGLGVAVVGLSAGGAWGIFTAVKARHPEFGALHGAAFHAQGPYLLASAAWALAVATALWALARRWAGVAALGLGAALLPTALAVALAFTMPGAAAVAGGPAAALLVAVLVAGLAGRRREGGTGVWVPALVAAVVALAFLVPPVELVADAMTFAFAPGIGALLGLTAVVLAPALEGLLAPNRWWAPVAGAVVAAAGIGVGVLGAAPDPEHPAPSTLIYVQDQGGPGRPVQAWWVGAGDGSLEWAAARVGADFDEELAEAGSYGVRSGLPAAVAPTLTLAPLRLRLLADTVVGAGRRVRVGIPRPRGPESMRVTLGEGAGLVALDTVDLPPAGATPHRALVHHGAPRDSLLEVEMELPLTATAVELSVQEELQRPWEVLDSAYWERDETLAPNIVTFSDRAIIRSFHRILLEGAGAMTPPSADTAGVAVPGAAPDSAASPRPDSAASPRPDSAAPPRPDSTGTRNGGRWRR
jgi:hypothetical protein